MIFYKKVMFLGKPTFKIKLFMELYLLNDQFFRDFSQKMTILLANSGSYLSQNHDNLFAFNDIFNQKNDKKEQKFYETDDKGNAIINIGGVLGNSRGFFETIMGVAPTLTYSEIIKAVEDANNDPSVKKIRFNINTPGGAVSGIDNVGLAIRNSKKPTETYTSTLATSAGYWLASQTDKIIATSELTMFGSIGVAQTFYVDPQGITITSKKAPYKIPAPDTKAGKEVIQGQLDAIHSIFVKRVSTGRNVSEETVNEDFGQGGVMLAEESLRLGMIDALVTQEKILGDFSDGSLTQANQKTVINLSEKKSILESAKIPEQNNKLPEIKKQEKKKMDLNTLKTEHKELYSEILKEGEKKVLDNIEKLSAYKAAAPNNDKLVALVDEAIASNTNFDVVLPKLIVALQSQGVTVQSNAPTQSTSTVDPVEQSAQAKAELEKQNQVVEKTEDEIKAEFKKQFGFKL